MKHNGHYCKICGEYKANEKFSGKGHAVHICKACQALPLEKRNIEATLTRLMNLPYRLSKEQIAWLKTKCKDKRPEISSTAMEISRSDSRMPRRTRKNVNYISAE